MENSFEINGVSFKLSKIDAFKQFHIVRRVAPILGDLLPAMGGLAKSVEGLSESEKVDQFAKVLSPVIEGLSKLSDADSEYVLFGLLSAVEIKQSSGNYAKIAGPAGMMIQNLELPVLLQAAGRAFAFNLSGFFSALPRAS